LFICFAKAPIGRTAFSKATQIETIIIRTVKEASNSQPIPSQGSTAGFPLDATPKFVGPKSVGMEPPAAPRGAYWCGGRQRNGLLPSGFSFVNGSLVRFQPPWSVDEMTASNYRALSQHAAVGLKTLGNDGNCCIVEDPLFGFEIAVPVPPGATVAPGSVGDTDSKPTPVQGRPLSGFRPGFGWIKVFGSAGGTLSSDRACKSVLSPLSTGLVVFWASAAVADTMMAPRTISPMRSATMVISPRILMMEYYKFNEISAQSSAH
jgi:hypothetical protein